MSGISTSVNRLVRAASASSPSSAETISNEVRPSAAARRAMACSSAPLSGLSGRAGSSVPNLVAAASSSVCDRSAGLHM